MEFVVISPFLTVMSHSGVRVFIVDIIVTKDTEKTMTSGRCTVGEEEPGRL